MSLQASQAGIKLAKAALAGMRLNQTKLATRLVVDRQQISKFFNGKSIGDVSFVEICETLKLDWQAITEQAPLTAQELDNASEVDAIVQAIREQIKPIVREKCGTMRVLDMTQPIELTGERGIYTNVNILERITGRNRLEVAEILRNCGVEEFDRFGLSRVTEKRVPGLEAVENHHKLMVLGKPGAGKSTFLKYLAMQCIEGNFQANRIPIFITLKDFAEVKGNPDLFTYISQLIELPASDALRKILQQGQLLVLLDGLDEVREEDTKRVLRQILEFSDQFHLNQFVITCRIAAKEYTFERFTEVEVADFDPEQIAVFAQNWFRRSDPVKAERFMQKLEENEPIQELASSPLLLTLLCLVFQAKDDFPKKRSKLYQEGIELLLKQWDVKRGIDRDYIYKNLPLKKKQDLLSDIALTTFKEQNYFFEPEAIEEVIESFFYRSSDLEVSKEDLGLDGKAVLRAIEAQHGLLIERAKSIYSFSHLTFQEYFAARAIVVNSAYANLVKHLAEKRWHEVFLLTASMMRNAGDLLRLMKQTIDEMSAADELQQFLSWVDQKSTSVEVTYKPATVRAFYFTVGFPCSNSLGFVPNATIAFGSDLSLALALDPTIEFNLSRNSDFDLDFALTRDLTLACDYTLTSDISLARDLARDLALTCNLARSSKLKRRLQEIKDQLSDYLINQEKFERWGRESAKVWAEQLRTMMIEHRNIGHDFQFRSEQQQLLKQYYDANELLVDCLNSDCYVSRDVRQEIEETLLLPISEIEKRKQN